MMKTVIWNMKEISESTEVYESHPNPFLTGTIYLILAIVGISFLWMYLAKIDIVVKGNGLFRGEENGINVSAGISGKVKTCEVTDGQYVEEGQTLLTLEVDSLENSIESCEQELEEAEQRIAILQAYQKSLDGTENAMGGMESNPYYAEFLNRKQLLEASIAVTDENIAGQRSQYQSNIDSIEDSVDEYQKKVDKLNKAITGVKKRKNPFEKKDSYYHSIVSSYLSSYESVSLQYDNQISEYQNNIDALNTEKNQVMQAVLTVEEGAETGLEEVGDTAVNTGVTIDQEIQKYQNSIETAEAEKEKALQSLELQQIASLEQEITSVQSAIQSLKENAGAVKVQMEALKGQDTAHSDDVTIMTEKNNVANELLTYQNKKQECENNLNSLKVQDGNCQIEAMASGYVMMQEGLEQGQYVQQGTEICQILPEEHSGYYAEVYVENKDVAKLKEGQEVKFEIAAYPSSEYGYFTGTLDSISKDVRVDQSTGASYYVAKVLCDKTTVTNKKGETGTIQNGMACQAKVVVSAQRVWNYVLEKINLTD